MTLSNMTFKLSPKHPVFKKITRRHALLKPEVNQKEDSRTS
jgi:hypothetical protein